MPRHLTEDDLTRRDAERDAYRHITLHRVPVLLQAETSVCAPRVCLGLSCKQFRQPCTEGCPTRAEMACADPDPEPRNPAKRSRWNRFVRDLARWLRRSRLRL